MKMILRVVRTKMMFMVIMMKSLPIFSHDFLYFNLKAHIMRKSGVLFTIRLVSIVYLWLKLSIRDGKHFVWVNL